VGRFVHINMHFKYRVIIK